MLVEPPSNMLVASVIFAGSARSSPGCPARGSAPWIGCAAWLRARCVPPFPESAQQGLTATRAGALAEAKRRKDLAIENAKKAAAARRAAIKYLANGRLTKWLLYSQASAAGRPEGDPQAPRSGAGGDLSGAQPPHLGQPSWSSARRGYGRRWKPRRQNARAGKGAADNCAAACNIIECKRSHHE